MVYIPCTLMGMDMEEAVRIVIHTVYFDGHGHGGGSKDWYTYHALLGGSKDWYMYRVL